MYLNLQVATTTDFEICISNRGRKTFYLSLSPFKNPVGEKVKLLNTKFSIEFLSLLKRNFFLSSLFSFIIIIVFFREKVLAPKKVGEMLLQFFSSL